MLQLWYESTTNFQNDIKNFVQTLNANEPEPHQNLIALQLWIYLFYFLKANKLFCSPETRAMLQFQYYICNENDVIGSSF
jgi:hypothetical protein